MYMFLFPDVSRDNDDEMITNERVGCVRGREGKGWVVRRDCARGG